MKHSSRSNLVPVAAALALALVAGPLFALDAPPDPPPGPQGPLAGYLRCLGIVGLTDAQKADVKSLLEAAKPEMEAIREALKTVSYEGVTGVIVFDENGDADKDTAYIKGVDNAAGEFTFVKMQTVADLENK